LTRPERLYANLARSVAYPVGMGRGRQLSIRRRSVFMCRTCGICGFIRLAAGVPRRRL